MTVNTLSEPGFSDLTARARIREAALRLFAEKGIQGATVRDIANAAGVSGGLVTHHFGAKEQLRAECDRYVLERLMRFKERAVIDGEISNPAFLSTAQPEILLMMRYFAHSVEDGSPTADAIFDQMVVLAKQWLLDHNPGQVPDLQGYAALLIAMEVGGLVMHRQLSRALGADIFTPDGFLRLAKARLEFYSKPLLSAEFAHRAQEAIDDLTNKPSRGRVVPAATRRKRQNHKARKGQ